MTTMSGTYDTVMSDKPVELCALPIAFRILSVMTNARMDSISATSRASNVRETGFHDTDAWLIL